MQLYVSRLNPAALPSSSQLQCSGQDCGYPMTQSVYLSNQLSWYAAVFKPSTFPFWKLKGRIRLRCLSGYGELCWPNENEFATLAVG